MSEPTAAESALGLAWSLWTELGLPGAAPRNHSFAVLDPEATLLFTPSWMQSDPRLCELALAWCGQHGRRNRAAVSVVRLRRLFASSNESTRAAFSALSAALGRRYDVAWPTDDAGPWPPGDGREMALPMERPSLLRFRLRAALGLGARADVVFELLANHDDSVTAKDLMHLGYAKRAIASVLEDLADAGVATRQTYSNGLRFRLARPDALRTWVGAEATLVTPRWIDLFTLTAIVVALEGHSGTERVRRVAADKARAAVLPVAQRVGLDPPPVTRDRPDAFEEMLAWGRRTVEDLAGGVTSKAFGVEAVRATPDAHGKGVWVWVHNSVNPRLKKSLAQPRRPDVLVGTIAPTGSGWVAYQLIAQARGTSLRNLVETLVYPYKVAWNDPVSR